MLLVIALCSCVGHARSPFYYRKQSGNNAAAIVPSSLSNCYGETTFRSAAVPCTLRRCASHCTVQHARHSVPASH